MLSIGTSAARARVLLSIGFWLVAIGYSVLFTLDNLWFNAAFKAFPALLLFAWLAAYSRHRLDISAIVFLVCAVGDVLLAMPFEYSFIAGLSTFLFAHLLLVYRLAPYRKNTPKRLIAIGVITLLATISGVIILRNSGSLFWPVLLYIAIITSMALFAILAAHRSLLLAFGAVTFLVSDLLIGINRFVLAFPFEHQLIMLTYYTGIYLLALGLVNGGFLPSRTT